MKTLILPIGGKSSRFKGMKPKWMLRMPSGYMMATESLRGINFKQFDRVLIIGLEEQVDDIIVLAYEIEDVYKIHTDTVTIDPTQSQPATVAAGIEKDGTTGAIFIKDCDGYFPSGVYKKNAVTVMDLNHAGKIDAGSKSYVVIGSKNIIGNIVEKSVISNMFSVGGYYFEDVDDYMKYWKIVKRSRGVNNTGTYISHIVYAMILNDYKFEAVETTEFIDWGTKVDYIDYLRTLRESKSVIIDVDNTLCHTDITKPYEELLPRISVCQKLRDYKKKGFYIIIQTGRNMKTYNCNLGQINANTAMTLVSWLDYHKIPYDEIYYGRPWCGMRGFYVCDSTIRPDEFVNFTYEQIQKKLKKCRGK